MGISKSSAAAAVVGLLRALVTAKASASALALNRRCLFHHQEVSEKHIKREDKSEIKRKSRGRSSKEITTAWLRNAPASSEQGQWLRPTPGRSAVTKAVGSARRLRRWRFLHWFHHRGQATRVKSVS
jgi:hypothetical protein